MPPSSVNEVFPLEKGTEMQNLPNAQTRERDEREPGEILDALICRCCRESSNCEVVTVICLGWTLTVGVGKSFFP